MIFREMRGGKVEVVRIDNVFVNGSRETCKNEIFGWKKGLVGWFLVEGVFSTCACR